MGYFKCQDILPVCGWGLKIPKVTTNAAFISYLHCIPSTEIGSEEHQQWTAGHQLLGTIVLLHN